MTTIAPPIGLVDSSISTNAMPRRRTFVITIPKLRRTRKVLNRIKLTADSIRKTLFGVVSKLWSYKAVQYASLFVASVAGFAGALLVNFGVATLLAAPFWALNWLLVGDLVFMASLFIGAWLIGFYLIGWIMEAFGYDV